MVLVLAIEIRANILVPPDDNIIIAIIEPRSPKIPVPQELLTVLQD